MVYNKQIMIFNEFTNEISINTTKFTQSSLKRLNLRLSKIHKDLIIIKHFNEYKFLDNKGKYYSLTNNFKLKL